MRTQLLTVFSVLTFLASASLAPARAGAQTDESAPIATDSVAQSGTSVRIGRASGLVAAPIDEVFAVVSDYAHYTDFLPHFRASRVLSQRGSQAMAYLEVAVLHDTATLWAQVRLRARTEDDGRRIIEARRVDGNVDRFYARWELEPTEGGTRVTFQLGVDPGLPVPSSLVTDENVRFARKGLRALRRRVAAQG